MASFELNRLLESLPTLVQGENSTLSFDSEDPVYIYGAGNVGKDVFRALASRGISIAGFLDRKAEPGATWESVRVLAPDDVALSAAQRQRSHVLIGIFNRETEIAPIIEFLQGLGYGRVTSFLELHSVLASELGDRFWLTSRSFYLNQTKEIAQGYDLWSDQTSRDVYEAILKFRLTQFSDVLPRPDFEDQYFPAGLPAWPQPVRFVDCGAFDGDTLRVLTEGRTKIAAVAAFEPDPLNFTKLADFMHSRAANVTDTVCLYPCGVGAETSQIRFSSGNGTSSCASKDGNSVIQCVKLDEALPAFRPNVIKMDIEGAEYDALLGARKMIERDRPGLAISVYHRPEHLWTIPLLIDSWVPGGKHYLRMHAYNGFELIFYWYP